MLADEYARRAASSQESCRHAVDEVISGTAPNLVRLSTELSSFVADSFSQKICSTLRRGTTLYLREELPMFARIPTLSDCSLIHSETSPDPAVTVPTNLSRSRILVLDPVLSRLLYFGAFAFFLLSHSHL
jgi:hypothetical protein